jgi:hypothetical protein
MVATLAFPTPRSVVIPLFMGFWGEVSISPSWLSIPLSDAHLGATFTLGHGAQALTLIPHDTFNSDFFFIMPKTSIMHNGFVHLGPVMGNVGSV